jgi:2-polyprenyl-3-methyl-5-hydroxy-6-metoxy-1,4-benzoquinol methylase
MREILKMSIIQNAKHLVNSMFHYLRKIYYNGCFMRLAELYLQNYFTYDTWRRWRGSKTTPGWFDHRADLFRWSKLRNSFWVERGVFCREIMAEGCRVLDLCCGDGFFPYHFYADIASLVDAVDIDALAITHACKWHSHAKITYSQIDIVRDDFPRNEYDVITWDGSIEHFSAEQIQVVLKKCVEALRTSRGILCGYTIITHNAGQSGHSSEFGSAAELKQLLKEFFPFVGTVETKYPQRHNIYFRAAFNPAYLKRFA